MALYPEASGTWTGRTWVLQAPWMCSTIDGFPAGREPAHAEDLYSFDNVKRLPFWFHPPRFAGELEREFIRGSFDEQALVGFLIRARSILHLDFSWSLEDVLSGSICADAEGALDPLSIFGAMQRLILLDSQAVNELGEQVRNALPSISKSQKKSLFLDLVHVSHHVTRNAPPLILDSMEFKGEAESCLRKFLADEKDHDVFARKSLLLLTADQESCDLFMPPPELLLLIELLGLCAQASPLGLASCLFIFEGLAYDAPVWTPWDDLAQMDARHAQQGVGKHTRINEKARHGDIGFQLARVLPAQSGAEAGLAVRITELCMQLRLQLFKKLYSSVGLAIEHRARVGGLETTPGTKPGSQLPFAGNAQLSK